MLRPMHPCSASLKHCRSRKELILAARRLGYRITHIDLQRAWQEEQLERSLEAEGSANRKKLLLKSLARLSIEDCQVYSLSA